MKIIIDITEAQALGLGYLAGVECRSRKNYIETTLRKHLDENRYFLDQKTSDQMEELERAGSAQGEA
jgi:hypothetical protein